MRFVLLKTFLLFGHTEVRNITVSDIPIAPAICIDYFNFIHVNELKMTYLVINKQHNRHCT